MHAQDDLTLKLQAANLRNEHLQHEIESLREFIEACNKNIKMVNDDRDSEKRQKDEWKRRFFKFATWSCRAGAFIKHNPEAAQWFEEE